MILTSRKWTYETVKTGHPLTSKALTAAIESENVPSLSIMSLLLFGLVPIEVPLEMLLEN
ncbi:MAG: hypothetical protein H7836_16670 [Magnetococcus sp. YQC-3]